jgi:AraC-like DNA-binding protein
VPRIVWSLLPSYGKHTRAAVIHDALCSEKKLASRHVHDLFLRMLETCGVSTIVRLSMHRAVRWFGPRFKGGPA